MRLSPRATAEVMIQVFRATSSLAFSAGLNPAQWSALRYFAQALPGARSVTAFARYHGTTKGTASQTVQALQKKGLVERRENVDDRRSTLLELTEKGHHMLGADPLNDLAAAIETLDRDRHGVLAEALEQILRTMLAGHAGPFAEESACEDSPRDDGG